MAKPAIDAKWATSGSALIQDPGAGKRDQGWIVEIPPVEFFNWWMNNVGNWIEYLDGEVDKVLAIQGLYDAIVGPGGTHTDINAVMADGALPATDLRIFILGPYTATVTQVVDKEGCELAFHPKSTFAKGGALVTGLQLDAARIKVLNGRFLNFDEVGGKAIELTGNADKCVIMGNSFNNNTSEVDDTAAASPNNVIANNIVE